MSTIEKLSTFEGLLQFGERLLKWAPPIVGTFLSSGLAGWATTATSAFGMYSPASWVFGGLAGAVLFAAAWLAWISAQLKMAQYAFAKDFASSPQVINPLESTFTKQRIDLNVFRTPTLDIAEGKVFVECELRGPAVVLFMGTSTFSNARFKDCEMVKVKDVTPVCNVLPFKDITVRGGKLCNLTILVPESAVSSMPPGALWLTT